MIKIERPSAIQSTVSEEMPDDEEVTALSYVSLSNQTSYLVVGTCSGVLQIIDLSTMQPCFIEGHGSCKGLILKEVSYLCFRRRHPGDEDDRETQDVRGQIICVNEDQNLFIYDVKERFSVGKPETQSAFVSS